jgi:putative transposase
MHVEPHCTADQLEALIPTEPRAKGACRLTAVRLALLGQTALVIAAQVLLSDRQVRTWVARSNAWGPDALADRPGRGRKGPRAPDLEQRLRDRLRAGSTDADGVCALRGVEVRSLLEREFGVVRGLQAAYDLLHRLGFAPLRPRPRHPRSDPEAQAASKKSSPTWSPASRPPTPTSGSRSGSRARPASASRGR